MSSEPFSESGRPRTLTPPRPSLPAVVDGWPSVLVAVALSTGLRRPAIPASAGTSAAESTDGAEDGEPAGVTVCWPYAVPSAVSGVSSAWATASAPSMSDSSWIVPAVTVWPPAATPSSVTDELARPRAGAGVVAADAGPATAARTAAAAAVARRGDGRTWSSW